MTLHYEIRKAELDEVKDVVKFIDSTFTVEGYGFVTSAQIKTEIRRRAVWIAVTNDKIIGVRVGISRVYNLAVDKEFRGVGVGKALIKIHDPDFIRVKATPVGNMSKKQKEEFTNPKPFYEKIGFRFLRFDFARNFWAGEKKVDGKTKRILVSQGEKKHIEIYENIDPKQLKLF